MRYLLVVIALFILAGHSFAGKTGELKIHLRDPFGAPIANAKIELGDKIVFSDELGDALFEGVVRDEYLTLKISDSEGICLPLEITVRLVVRSNERYYKLEWTPAQWEKHYSGFRLKRLAEVQELIDATDYSTFSDCDDTTGEHQFLDAQFPGGPEMLRSFINVNIRYPQQSIEMEEQGKVYLSFMIEADGEITDLNIVKGVSPSLDNEAKRCLRTMPNWVNAFCNGAPVRTEGYLPIVFTLQ